MKTPSKKTFDNPPPTDDYAGKNALGIKLSEIEAEMLAEFEAAAYMTRGEFFASLFIQKEEQLSLEEELGLRDDERTWEQAIFETRQWTEKFFKAVTGQPDCILKQLSYFGQEKIIMNKWETFYVIVEHEGKEMAMLLSEHAGTKGKIKVLFTRS